MRVNACQDARKRICRANMKFQNAYVYCVHNTPSKVLSHSSALEDKTHTAPWSNRRMGQWTSRMNSRRIERVMRVISRLFNSNRHADRRWTILCHGRTTALASKFFLFIRGLEEKHKTRQLNVLYINRRFFRYYRKSVLSPPPNTFARAGC